MTLGKKTFVELAKAKVKEKRNIVISLNETTNEYVMAQQAILDEGKKQTLIFIKGAIYIEGLEGMYNLRDALNEAITKEEGREKIF